MVDERQIPCIETSDAEQLCKHPLVSVNMQTYNHERFIRQAIEGVVMQETVFEYELILGEDCSTDRTREICFEYQKKFPDKIRVLWAEENVCRLFCQANVNRCFNRSRGKYIASCEGDDYWTDPKKLQKQVEYMEAHPGCAMTFHHRWVAGEDGVVAPENREPETVWEGVAEWPKVSCEYLLTHADMVPPTLTMLIRRSVVMALPSWRDRVALGDRTLAVLAAGRGTVEYVEGIGPSVYRRHDGGVSSRTGIVAQAIRQCESDMAFYEHLEIDEATRRIMVREMSSRAARVRIAQLGAPEALLGRFAGEVEEFGAKFPEFRWAYRRAFLWRAWSETGFRRLAVHRWWHGAVAGLKTVLPAQGYAALRRVWRGGSRISAKRSRLEAEDGETRH